jgi:alkane 1-monooxygenase
MEHYGMLRQKVGVGERERYERVDPSHSWNSNNIATNVLLYHLQRHSDHHANPTRRYQALRDYRESPVLPTGYAGMIVLAIVPAVWRRVMDPRVLRHFDGDLTRANLSPRKRDQILATYPVQPRAQAAPAGSGEPSGPGRRVGRTPPRDQTAVAAAAAKPPDVLSGSSETPSAESAGEADEALTWRCPGCGYTYDVVAGEEREGFAAGTAWSEIPDTWCCPDCGVRDKVDFVAVQSAVAR